MANYIVFLFFLFDGLMFFLLGSLFAFSQFKYSDFARRYSLGYFTAFSYMYAFFIWSELYMRLFGSRIAVESTLFYVEAFRLTLLLIPMFFLALSVFTFIQVFTNRQVMYIKAYVVLLFICYLGPLFFLENVETSNISKAFSYLFNYYSLFLLGPLLCIIGVVFIAYAKQNSPMMKRHFTMLGGALVFLSIARGFAGNIQWHNLPIFEVFGSLAVLFYTYALFTAYSKKKLNDYEKQFENALEADKYKTIGQLAMGVAHEINNPLGITSLSLSLLKKDSSEERFQELLGRARLGLDRASSICTSLLQYSNSADERFLECSVINVIHDAKEILSNKAKQNPIVVKCADSLSFKVMPVKITQVIINLLSNAIDASENGEQIEVFARQSCSNNIEIKIKDYGAGMDEATLSRVFEPFFSTKQIGQGTGLGLAICENIIKSHNASFHIWSNKGQGTTVIITIPGETEQYK